MVGFPEILDALDPWLIWAFRLPTRAEYGFALGLLWVSLAATMVGEISSRIIVRCNRDYFKGLKREMVKNHNLSLRALAVKDKASYKASNTMAHDAFGRHFFAQLSLSASSLWTVPFALGWFDYRFPGVLFPFPLAGEVGAPFLFMGLHRAEESLDEESERMLRMDDLVKKAEPGPRD
jgi:hypothetical protein